MRLVYYKASGLWAPFGLIGLYGSMTFSALILGLISHLFWGYFPSARGSALLVLIAWFGVTIIAAKHSVKVFKIRNPGLAFLITMLGIFSGYLMTWVLFWAISTEAVGFIDFIGTNMSKPALARHLLTFKKTRDGLTGGPMVLACILGLYFFFPAAMAKIQAEYPFNEQGDRWFNKKVLPPIKFVGQEASETERVLFKGKVDEFTRRDNYCPISNWSYFFSIFVLNSAKIWFFHDRESSTVYLNVSTSRSRQIQKVLSNLQITRAQAQAIYRKIALRRVY